MIAGYPWEMWMGHKFTGKILITALIAALCVGVGIWGWGVICVIRSQQLPEEYDKIRSSSNWRSEYLKLPLEKQIDMYTYMMVNEPPANRYTDLLASNGKKVVPYILDRLATEDREYIKVCLIRTLRVMHEHYYSLRNEPETIENLKATVAGMRDSEFKETSGEQLKRILD
jgi:hypothetical protein